MKACPQDCLCLVLISMQASQAAQEAEINARKAKNSVTSLLSLINDLLEQLGEYLSTHSPFRRPLDSLYFVLILLIQKQIIIYSVNIV